MYQWTRRRHSLSKTLHAPLMAPSPTRHSTSVRPLQRHLLSFPSSFLTTLPRLHSLPTNLAYHACLWMASSGLSAYPRCLDSMGTYLPSPGLIDPRYLPSHMTTALTPQWSTVARISVSQAFSTSSLTLRRYPPFPYQLRPNQVRQSLTTAVRNEAFSR